MTPEEQKTFKETFDLLKEMANEYVENKLPLLRKYIDLEGMVTKILSDAVVGKPSLFTDKGTPAELQHPFPEPLFTKPLTGDPLKQGMAGKAFDHLPEPPEPKKEPIIVHASAKLPWEQDANEPEAHPYTPAEKIAALPKKVVENPF